RGDPVTIRQALWIARLHGITLITRASKAKGKNKNLDLWGWLWAWSKAYAQCERLALATTQLDKAIWQGAWPITANNAVDLLYPDVGKLETAIEITERDGE
ncbi:MAG TPA: hypothetical protein VMW00_03460, partial [Dehalococcoidales bacterium]|nr:hypothetical protein [Dehalococcoidales bacterium]